MRSQELLRGFTGRRECSCVLSALVARVQETVLCWVLERREGVGGLYWAPLSWFCSGEVRSASYWAPLRWFCTLHGTVWLLEIPGCTGLSRRLPHAAEEGRQRSIVCEAPGDGARRGERATDRIRLSCSLLSESAARGRGEEASPVAVTGAHTGRSCSPSWKAERRGASRIGAAGTKPAGLLAPSRKCGAGRGCP